MSKKNKIVSTQISPELHEKMMQVVEKEFLNKSDYLRNLIRQDLERRGLIKQGAE